MTSASPKGHGKNRACVHVLMMFPEREKRNKLGFTPRGTGENEAQTCLRMGNAKVLATITALKNLKALGPEEKHRKQALFSSGTCTQQPCKRKRPPLPWLNVLRTSESLLRTGKSKHGTTCCLLHMGRFKIDWFRSAARAQAKHPLFGSSCSPEKGHDRHVQMAYGLDGFTGMGRCETLQHLHTKGLGWVCLEAP